MYKEEIFNIELFEFADGDVSDEGYSYFDVKWLIPELKQYNGFGVNLNQNQDIKIYNNDGLIIKEINLIDINSFKMKLLEKYTDKKTDIIDKLINEYNLTPEQIQQTYDRYVWHCNYYEELRKSNEEKQMVSGEKVSQDCPNCGHAANWNFCPNCGLKLKW